MLVETLYRTNRSIVYACELEGIEEFDIEMIEDLEQCNHCNVWWHGYELLPDIDGNNICKFCESYYGM
jgi:hypothetical protein